MNDPTDIIIAVDFDGTIAGHRYPDIGLPVAGAFEVLKRFQACGAKLILWTMRSGQTLDEAVKFCRENGVEFWKVNENTNQLEWTDSPKAYAHIYIDDAALGCPIRPSPRMGERPVVDWEKVEPLVMEKIRAMCPNCSCDGVTL